MDIDCIQERPNCLIAEGRLRGQCVACTDDTHCTGEGEVCGEDNTCVAGGEAGCRESFDCPAERPECRIPDGAERAGGVECLDGMS